MSRTQTQTFGAASVPRDPSKITPTEHFLRRFSGQHGYTSETRQNPPITPDVIERCITEGVVSNGRDGAILYEAHVDGYDWRLVVGVDNDAPVVVTAYVPGVHGAEKYGGEQ